jgi:hypothetical protein
LSETTSVYITSGCSSWGKTNFTHLCICQVITACSCEIGASSTGITVHTIFHENLPVGSKNVKGYNQHWPHRLILTFGSGAKLFYLLPVQLHSIPHPPSHVRAHKFMYLEDGNCRVCLNVMKSLFDCGRYIPEAGWNRMSCVPFI